MYITKQLLLCTLITGSLVAGESPAQEPPLPQNDDVIVQPRGPIHEAFARPLEQKPEPGQIIPQAPPTPVPEIPPEQKPEASNSEWIPGYWSWSPEQKQFVWVSGCWRVPPPGRRWVPGHWVEANGGHQWVPGLWLSTERQEVQYLPQVPDTLEQGPSSPAPNDNCSWVPGCWFFRDNDWVWRPGYWLDYQPGWTWVASNYSWTPRGSVFADGYWDYGFEDRGLLFAPVCFNNGVWNNPGWFYQPNYCLNFGAVLGSLFCQPNWNRYCYGNYWGGGFGAFGYQPWYAYGRQCYDPLFNYYRGLNYGNPSWYAGLRQPRADLAFHTPLNRRDGLTRLSAAQMQQQVASAQQFRDLATRRREVERPVAGPPSPTGRTLPPRLQLPQVASATGRGSSGQAFAGPPRTVGTPSGNGRPGSGLQIVTPGGSPAGKTSGQVFSGPPRTDGRPGSGLQILTPGSSPAGKASGQVFSGPPRTDGRPGSGLQIVTPGSSSAGNGRQGVIEGLDRGNGQTLPPRTSSSGNGRIEIVTPNQNNTPSPRISPPAGDPRPNPGLQIVTPNQKSPSPPRTFSGPERGGIQIPPSRNPASIGSISPPAGNSRPSTPPSLSLPGRTAQPQGRMPSIQQSAPPRMNIPSSPPRIQSAPQAPRMQAPPRMNVQPPRMSAPAARPPAAMSRPSAPPRMPSAPPRGGNPGGGRPAGRR